MSTLTGRSTRTITGHLSTLLEYARLVIDRDVDFTHCHYSGHYDNSIAECTTCSFGEACQWLNQDRTPSTDAGNVDELVTALQAAVQYLQAKSQHSKRCNCRNCSWLREARQFLHSRQHLT